MESANATVHEMEVPAEQGNVNPCNVEEKSQTAEEEQQPKSGKGDNEEDSPKPSSLKTLSDGHKILQGNLRQALFELTEKEGLLKDLEENEFRQREKTWLLEERIRLMNEKLVCHKRCLERKEKKQENMLTELADAKWKLQEAKKNLEKFKHEYAEMQQKKQQRQQELADLDGHGGVMRSVHDELQQDIMRLRNYKTLLAQGDPQMSAIQNGSKIMELEQRKRALLEATDERSARSESLYVEMDEKSERVQQAKKSLENAKKQHQEMLRDRKNHYGYLAETELRLQRSLEYLQSKIDYGTYKPAPWPNIRETLRLNNNM